MDKEEQFFENNKIATDTIKSVVRKKKVGVKKKDVIYKFIEINNKEPNWINLKFKDMDNKQKGEYNKYRRMVIKKISKSDIDKKHKRKESIIDRANRSRNNIASEKSHEEGYYSVDENKITKKELTDGVMITAKKAIESENYSKLTDDEKIEHNQILKDKKLIEKYFEKNVIDTQDKLNYAVEHDEKFRGFLESINAIEEYYKGSNLPERVKPVEEVKIDESKLTKKELRKLKKKKVVANNQFDKSKKDFPIEKMRNKKLENSGEVLCMYLQKNGKADFRYVKIDEVGMIRIGGYIYHERDSLYRVGKSNIPLLVILEGSLTPVSRATLNEYLGCDSAEAQRLVIKLMEHMEIIKMADGNGSAKTPVKLPKWVIIAVVAAIVAGYFFFGGFT